MPAGAQAAATDGLFSATVDGDRRDARFGRAPPRQRSDGRSRFGEIAPPGPPASGASTTGFDSTNSSRRRARPALRSPVRGTAAARPAVPRVAVRPGPEPGRRGALADPSMAPPNTVPTIATPTRRRSAADLDPFEPVGIRAGAFTLWPAIELTGGYDSNPPRSEPALGSSLFIVAPELKVRSDWLRHSLNADIKGSYTDYGRTFVCCNNDGTVSSTPRSLDRPALDAKVTGRVDATRDDRFDLEGRVVVATDNPGRPDAQSGLDRLTVYTIYGGTLGYAHRFNRFEIAAKGLVDRRVYQASELTDGGTSNNDDRNYNQYAGGLRGSYELMPGLKPFVEVGIDSRVHDLAVDRTGMRRDSDGMTVRAGTTFEFSRKLVGEGSAGYLNRRYKDPTLPEVNGFVFDARLVWSASALTTVTMTAASTVDEIILAGVSGALRRDIGFQVDHAFRRWLIGSLKLGYGFDDYIGLNREDQRYYASLGLIYKLSREIHFKGELRRDWLTSNVSGADYTADLVTFGVRLQR